MILLSFNAAGREQQRIMKNISRTACWGPSDTGIVGHSESKEKEAVGERCGGKGGM